jgi:formate--tetrahydrofolate ligase
MYGAAGVEYDPEARESLRVIDDLGYSNLAICIAKTPLSLSDRAELRGAPRDFTIKVNEVKLSAGAGLIVVLAGNIVTMPGLPRVPAAELMQVDDSGSAIRLV